MAFVEKTGKSVDEAVAAALAELNVTADQAVVEVLEEAKKGFLGFGRKDARVRVSVKPAEAEAEKPAEAAPAAEKTVSEAAGGGVPALRLRRGKGGIYGRGRYYGACSCSKGGCNRSCRCSG